MYVSLPDGYDTGRAHTTYFAIWFFGYPFYDDCVLDRHIFGDSDAGAGDRLLSGCISSKSSKNHDNKKWVGMSEQRLYI